MNRAEYQKIEAFLPGQHLPWLKQLRSDASTRFSTQGFPSPREEEWRYTNVSAIEKKQFTPVLNAQASNVDAEWLARYQLPDTWQVVLIDGRFAPQYSRLEGIQDNVIVCSMADALNDYPLQVEQFLGQAVANEDHGFIHFNTAWFNDGVFIHVPEKTQLQKPVQLLHVVTRADALVSPRNLLVAEANAEIDLVETYLGCPGLAYLTASLNEVLIGRNAQVSIAKLQNEADKAFHFGGTYVKQARDARLVHHNFAFGGLLARNEIHTDLEQAAECQLNGLYLGSKRQLIDNHTRIHHLKPHAFSRETYKGILDQRARGVFQGRVIVFEDAQKTDSEMNNRNLLLSDDAEVDTKPQLEIYADDVKCAHGVTVGQLEGKSIFYLQSRGVDAETARNLLTFAFANEMVDKIDLQSLRSLVLEQLLARFPQSGMRKEWL